MLIRGHNGQNKYYVTTPHQKSQRHLLTYYSRRADIAKIRTQNLIVQVVEYSTSVEFTISLSLSGESESTDLERMEPKMWHEDIWLY